MGMYGSCLCVGLYGLFLVEIVVLRYPVMGIHCWVAGGGLQRKFRRKFRVLVVLRIVVY